MLRTLVRTLLEYGVKDLVIDPGTFPYEGLADTVNNLTMIRRAAIRDGDELLGLPIVGVPLTAWIDMEGSPEVAAWNETYIWYYASNMSTVSHATLSIIKNTLIDSTTGNPKPGYWEISRMAQNSTWEDLKAQAKKEGWDWFQSRPSSDQRCYWFAATRARRSGPVPQSRFGID
jgi:hypothetical protein